MATDVLSSLQGFDLRLRERHRVDDRTRTFVVVGGGGGDNRSASDTSRERAIPLVRRSKRCGSMAAAAARS